MLLLNQNSLIQQHSNVATVWLLSTLGVKSNYKKISKKQIQDISIPETVTIITEPENLDNIQNLRVSSNLLYGVAIVYKQKLNYLENDTVNVKAKLTRDLIRFLNPNSKNNMIQIPNEIAMNNNLFIEMASNTNSKDTRSVFLQEDPMFNVIDDLLPPLDFLTQQPADLNSNSERIKRQDLLNNTVVSTTATNDEYDNIFTQNRANDEDDHLINEVEFAFDEEGFLLDLQNEPIRQSSSKQATPHPEFEERNDYFDFSFQEDRDAFPLPQTPQEGTSISSDLDPTKASTPSILGRIQEEAKEAAKETEMDQIFDEVELEAEGHAIEEPVEQIKPVKTKPIKKKRPASVVIASDIEISLTTDQLRDFRDNYVTRQMSKYSYKRRDLNIDKFNKIFNSQTMFLPKIFTFTKSAQQDLAPSKSFVVENEEDNERVENIETARNQVDKENDFVDELMLSNDVSEIEVARRSSRRHSSSIPSFNLGNIDENDNGPPVEFFNDGCQDFDYGEVFDIALNEDETITPVKEGTNSSSSSKRRISSSFGGRFNPVSEGDDEVEAPQAQLQAQLDDHDHDHDYGNLPLNSKSEKFYKFLLTKIAEDENRIMFADIFNGKYQREIVVKSFYEMLQLSNSNKVRIDIFERSDEERFKVLTGNDFEIVI